MEIRIPSTAAKIATTTDGRYISTTGTAAPSSNFTPRRRDTKSPRATELNRGGLEGGTPLRSTERVRRSLSLSLMTKTKSSFSAIKAHPLNQCQSITILKMIRRGMENTLRLYFRVTSICPSFTLTALMMLHLLGCLSGMGLIFILNQNCGVYILLRGKTEVLLFTNLILITMEIFIYMNTLTMVI